jgi:Mg2+/Co2+ transporter CorC
MIASSVAAVIVLAILSAAHRLAAARMLVVRSPGQVRRVLEVANEARPALVISEVLAVGVVAWWVFRLDGSEPTAAVSVGIAALAAALLVNVNPGAGARDPAPAWLRGVARATRGIRRRVAHHAVIRPAEPDPLGEQTLVERMLRFRGMEISEVIVPRREVVGLAKGSELPRLIELVERHRHSRYPVYEGNLDRVVGRIDVFDLLGLRPGERELDRIIRPVLIVPEGKRCDDLLAEMMTTGDEFAIVVDEFGGTAGLVTVEDIVERLVGEIWDEHERETVPLKRVGRRAFVAEASITLSELEERIGLELPEGDYDTLAGFLLAAFGRIPVRGDTISSGGVVLEVLTAERRRIGSVKILLPDAEGGR